MGILSSREILVEASRLRAVKKLKLPDAIHVATALRSRCEIFLTNDQHLKVAGGLEKLDCAFREPASLTLDPLTPSSASIFARSHNPGTLLWREEPLEQLCVEAIADKPHIFIILEVSGTSNPGHL